MDKTLNFDLFLPSSDNDGEIADVNVISNNFKKIDEKAVVKEDGKGLSSEDFTLSEKEKLKQALTKNDVDSSFDPLSEKVTSGIAVEEARKQAVKEAIQKAETGNADTNYNPTSPNAQSGTAVAQALNNAKKYYDLILPSDNGDGLGNFPFVVEHNGKRIEAFTVNTNGREPSSSSGYAEIKCYIAVYYLDNNNKIPIFKKFTPTDIENISFVIKGKPEDPIGFTEDVIYDWNLLISMAETILPHKITASTTYEEQIYPYDNYGVYKLSIRANNITTNEEYKNFTENFAAQISLIAARAKDITITWSKYDADKSDVALSDGFTQVTKTREMI